MKVFRLPDLGEGLTEAEVLECFVSPGQMLQQGQEMFSLQTAKAVVQIPVPETAQVEKICVKPGDTVHVGEKLIIFSGEEEDSGTVVGRVEAAEPVSIEEYLKKENQPLKGDRSSQSVSSWPSLFILQQQGLAIHEEELLSQEELQARWVQMKKQDKGKGEPLKGITRAMAEAMQQSQAQVVPVTLHEQVEITHWPLREDFTWRLVRALVEACHAAPVFNAHFHRQSMCLKQHDEIHLGLAMNGSDGLYVPVIRNVADMNREELRQQIEMLKQQMASHGLSTEQLSGATISLSNYGMLGGLWSTPVIVPPQVAILACGRPLNQLRLENEQLKQARYLPLSFTFDHQVASGRDAAIFLSAVKSSIES